MKIAVIEMAGGKVKLISWWEMKEVGPESQVRSSEPTLLQSLVQGMGHPNL